MTIVMNILCHQPRGGSRRLRTPSVDQYTAHRLMLPIVLDYTYESTILHVRISDDRLAWIIPHSRLGFEYLEDAEFFFSNLLDRVLPPAVSV